MIRAFQIVFVFLLIFSSTRYFGANFLNPSFVNYSQFCLSLLAIIAGVPYFFSKRGGFVFPIQLISLSIAISVLMAYVSWGQNFKDTLLVTIPMLLWPVFFYLIEIDFSVSTLEKILLLFGGVYIALYLYQYSHPDLMLFGKPNYGEEFFEDRGVIRIVPPGGGLLFLAVFIALNKFTTQKGGKWLWILFLAFGILIPIMQVTRVSIFGVAVIYLFHFLKSQHLSKKVLTIISCILIVFCISVTYTEIKPLKGMVEAQKQTAKEGDKYIRILAGSYFLTEFSPSSVSKILGNGVPYVDFTYYGKYVYNLNEKQGYYLEDLGIISVYVMYGLFAVISYVFIWIKTFRYGLPQKYQYVKYNLWFLLINGFTTVDLYFADHLICTVLTLYIYQNILLKEKLKQIEVGYSSRLLKFAPYNYRKSSITS